MDDDQNKLPELKLGKTLIPLFFFVMCSLFPLILISSRLIWWCARFNLFLGVFFFFLGIIDAKQAQGFLSFFKTLPQVSEIVPTFIVIFGEKHEFKLIPCFSFFCCQDPRAIRFFDRRVSSDLFSRLLATFINNVVFCRCFRLSQ